MASIQDIDTRLRVIEDKVDFIMRVFSTRQESPIVGGEPVVKTLLQKYYEAKQAALRAQADALGKLAKTDGQNQPVPSTIDVPASDVKVE